MGPLDNSAIADTVAVVFRGPAFAQHRSISIGEIIVEWIWRIVIGALGFAASHPAVGLVLRLALGALLLIVLIRIGYGLLLRRSAPALPGQRFDVNRGTDWWSAAQERASHGDYTGAAHALYLALLASVARRGLVSLHESKTTGDYLRELRRKPQSIDLPRFTDFTSSYETVIYGVGFCDHERFTRLNALARALLDAGTTATSSRSDLRGARA